VTCINFYSSIAVIDPKQCPSIVADDIVVMIKIFIVFIMIIVTTVVTAAHGLGRRAVEHQAELLEGPRY